MAFAGLFFAMLAPGMLETVQEVTTSRTRRPAASEAWEDELDDLLNELRQMDPGHVRVRQLQNDLDRLDREWEARRKSFMITDWQGRQRIPSPAEMVAMGLFYGVCDICVLGFMSYDPPRSLGPGLALVVALVCITAWMRGAASNYKKALGHRWARVAMKSERLVLVMNLEAARRRLSRPTP